MAYVAFSRRICFVRQFLGVDGGQHDSAHGRAAGEGGLAAAIGAAVAQSRDVWSTYPRV